LCAINKNIVNANEVINQPDKFYMNLFNNILQKVLNMSNESNGAKRKKVQGKLIGFSDALGICKKKIVSIVIKINNKKIFLFSLI
jgi:hypothetical protein